VSNWFRTYGLADVYEQLIIGAYPQDRTDVEMLNWLGVERILNLVEDEEYDVGARAEVEAALAEHDIAEHRMSLTDYGRIPPEELEQAVAEVLAWLDEGRRTYVHCRAGWQRSAAVAAGVVAIREHLDIDEALVQIQAMKPTANPLPHQRKDMRAWWDSRTG
jgi:predicted protein tyrosine phosphatase